MNKIPKRNIKDKQKLNSSKRRQQVIHSPESLSSLSSVSSDVSPRRDLNFSHANSSLNSINDQKVVRGSSIPTVCVLTNLFSESNSQGTMPLSSSDVELIKKVMDVTTTMVFLYGIKMQLMLQTFY